MNENHLSPLPQYHIDRDKLCEIVKGTVGYDRLMDAFCHGTVVCDEFAWFSNSDEYYIIHLESGMMVNWYKHLGKLVVFVEHAIDFRLHLQGYLLFLLN